VSPHGLEDTDTLLFSPLILHPSPCLLPSLLPPWLRGLDALCPGLLQVKATMQWLEVGGISYSAAWCVCLCASVCVSLACFIITVAIIIVRAMLQPAMEPLCPLWHEHERNPCP
ncbi:hypothetical protein M758_7G109100, partial [Ceratodon purpureus]